MISSGGTDNLWGARGLWHFYSFFKKIGQFSRHGVGVSSFISNLYNKQASKQTNKEKGSTSKRGCGRTHRTPPFGRACVVVGLNTNIQRAIGPALCLFGEGVGAGAAQRGWQEAILPPPMIFVFFVLFLFFVLLVSSAVSHVHDDDTPTPL